MTYTIDQVKARILQPENKSFIDSAIQQEKRIRMHVDADMTPRTNATSVASFLSWVEGLLPKDKFNVFKNLLTFPLDTVEVTDVIFKELERVFDGRNPVYNYQFTDSFYRDDWEYYRQEHFRSGMFLKVQGWEHLKTGINSIVVIDLPAEQTTDYPEPYAYFVSIEHVIDVDVNRKGEIEFLAFRRNKDEVVAITDQEYLVFENVKSSNNASVLALKTQASHDLKYAPCQFFWSTNLSRKNKIVKKSPLSPQLSKLDWLLFFSVSKKHLDLYAPYPIYSAYESECDFENNQTGEYCDGGYLRGSDGKHKVLGNGTLDKCPVCADKRLAGVGSLIEVPVPTTSDSPDLRNPVQITTIDSNSLKYNTEEVVRLAQRIITHSIGFDTGLQTASMNELQVGANFESRESVLDNLKMNFENIRKFIDDTICRLRYGAAFVSSTISLGTEFYIYSVDELYTKYSNAKKNGASDAELDAINEQIIATEYKNDPIQSQRMLILRHLEPFRHFTLDELLRMSDKNLLPKKDLLLKINFSNFVDRFERENTNIIEFGSALEFDKKIKVIQETLYGYVQEQLDQTQN